MAANQSFGAGFQQGQLSCASSQSNAATCLPPVAITAVPSRELHAPYFMEWSLGMEHQFGATASVKAQYVGTRAVNQPYQTQVNGYQTVCPGCFAPFPYLQPTDPRFAAVTQFSTGANSHYNGLQLTAMKRMGHGLQGQINYTWSHCMDEVSNGGFLQFSAGGLLSPLPGDLRRSYGPCDYDIRSNLTAQYVYQLPVKVRSQWLGQIVNNWQVSGTVFWHSGVPFSVLSTPYSANGNGVVQGSGPQFASLVPGVDPYCRHCDLASQHGRLRWRRQRGKLPIRQHWQKPVSRSWFCLVRYVLHKTHSSSRKVDHEGGSPVLQCLQSSQLCPAQPDAGRSSGQCFDADRIWGTDVYHLSTDWAARRRFGRRQQSAHDCIAG
jgi:hypothetical protein